jgi:hypothetical protein
MWLTQRVKKLIDYGRDDHPEDAHTDKAQAAWSVAILDDCDGCSDPRVELVLEELGQAGYGQVAHLGPATAGQLCTALRNALQELGEDVGDQR